MNGCDLSWSLASHFGLRDHRGDSMTDPSPDQLRRRSFLTSCWGYNGSGNLGNSTEGGQSPSPTLVSGERAWTSVDGGSQHTCGVTTEGDAYCWGYNGYGGLGDGTTTDSSVPVKVGGNW